EHSAHGPAGDDAGALRGRLQQHLSGAVSAHHLMRDRGAVLGHPEETLLGTLDRLLDRERHLVRLAVADADDLVFVAHDHERREREAAPTLHDLCDAVDRHDALLEVESLWAYAGVASHRLRVLDGLLA